MKLGPNGKLSVLDSYRHTCSVTNNMVLQAKRKKKTIFYTYKLLLCENTLQTETLEEKQQADYSTIEHLTESKNYIFLCSCKRQAYIIKKSNFSEEELAKLKDFLEFKCHKKMTDMYFLDMSKIKRSVKKRYMIIIIILGITMLINISILLWKYTR